MTRKACVLVVDDEAFVRESLVDVLIAEGFECATAESRVAAEAVLARRSCQVVVSDLSMPGGDGLELLRALKSQASTIPVVMMTGVGTIADAVQAMKAGAYDFLQKPVDVEQLSFVIRRALEHHELLGEVRILRERVQEKQNIEGLVGPSSVMDALRRQIEQVAATDATVLVTGESGTGKELVAEEIHRRGRRAARRLVRVNCAAVPSTLFESEFFGHKRGSFSGAVADRVGRFAEAEDGTLVLDEIGTLPLEIQSKLLRVLENGEYTVVGESRTRKAEARIIALTNENLAERTQRGEFRSDLYYRLNVFPIVLPPLRTHREDVPAIAEALIGRISTRMGDSLPQPGGCSAEALAVLGQYDWPGNVRELRNVLERALILAQGQALDAALLRGILESAFAVPQSNAGGDLHLRQNLDAAEKALVLRALDKSGGKKKDACQLLGIDPRNLGYYLRKHGLAESSSR